jgi:2-hydroxychromene-2-carboxylate isomerase
MSVPVPKRPSGFTLGHTNSRVTVDVFVDIQCPHSKKAWPVICQLVDHYKGEPVSVTVHLLTLSNHRQAWDMSLGLFAVAVTEAQVFFDIASYIYARQDQFYNGLFEHKTHNDLRQLVADFAAEHAGVERTWVLKRMADNDVYIDARTPIRYAATKAVWATPTFFFNNADNVPITFESTVDEWVKTIDALLT